jgi:glycerol kinase
VTKGLSFLPDGIPITGILGDQQSALFGQAGINPGDAKCTYGTGAFMLMNTGEKIQFSQRGLLTTIAYQYNGKISYALEGSCYIAGAAIQWLRDNLNFFTSSSECESFAQSITNDDEMKNILFLPFFTGIASPHWKSNAKAAIIGMTRDTNKYHLTRACLEGVAFSINDLLNSFKMDTNQIIKNLRVDGGMVANNFFCEIQSSVANLDIIRPRVIETTAYGAALAAGIGREILDLDHLQSFWKEERIFKPDNQKKHYFKNKYLQWENAIQKIY